MADLGEDITKIMPGKIPGLKEIRGDKKKNKDEKVHRKDKQIESIDFA
jgi:hypothetical protein